MYQRYRRVELFMSEPPPLDRYEGDLHHTLELDIDALWETGHRRGAKFVARMIRGSGLGA